jgi:hypothetical protein
MMLVSIKGANHTGDLTVESRVSIVVVADDVR